MDRCGVWDRLRKKGLRMTPLKKQVVGLFLDGGCGLSARDVLERLAGGTHISSVHRCLVSLGRAGFLRPDRTGDGVVRWRCSRSFYPDHGHFKCGRCGRRLPVEYRLPEDFLRKVETSGNFRVAGSDLYLEGVCRRCDSGDS